MLRTSRRAACPSVPPATRMRDADRGHRGVAQRMRQRRDVTRRRARAGRRAPSAAASGRVAADHVDVSPERGRRRVRHRDRAAVRRARRRRSRRRGRSCRSARGGPAAEHVGRAARARRRRRRARPGAARRSGAARPGATRTIASTERRRRRARRWRRPFRPTAASAGQLGGRGQTARGPDRDLNALRAGGFATVGAAARLPARRLSTAVASSRGRRTPPTLRARRPRPQRRHASCAGVEAPRPAWRGQRAGCAAEPLLNTGVAFRNRQGARA